MTLVLSSLKFKLSSPKFQPWVPPFKKHLIVELLRICLIVLVIVCVVVSEEIYTSLWSSYTSYLILCSSWTVVFVVWQNKKEIPLRLRSKTDKYYMDYIF